MKKLGIIAATIVALGTLGACSGDVPADDIEKQIQAELAKAGQDAEKVDCPDDLEGRVDTTMTCTATIGGEERKFKVTVVKVSGNKVEYNVEPA